jgi:hypothetical protein
MLRAAGKVYTAMAEKTDGEIANGTIKPEGNPSLTYPANMDVLWLSGPRTHSVVTVVHKIVMHLGC